MSPTPIARRPLARLTLAAIGVALPLALTACSSSPSATGTSGTSAPTGTTGTTATSGKPSTSSDALPSCDKVSASQVNAVFGTSLTSPAPQSGPSNVVTCYYSQSGSNLPTVIIRYQSGASASTLASDKAQESQAGFTVADVSGLGDAAWSGTNSAAGTTNSVVEVLKGSTIVQVSGPGTVEQVQSLMTQVLNLV